MTPWPALVVTRGPHAGDVFTVRTEHAVVGRDAAADFTLDGTGVSRKHLHVRRHGSDLLVEDLGSVNGTFVNGARLVGERPLHPGDTVELGEVELEYVVLGRTGATSTAAATYGFGDVHGPVNTGAPSNASGSQVVGQGSIYHGEVHHGDRIDVDLDPDGFQELFAGRGPGRLLMAVGLVVAFVGFGLWMSVIFSGFGDLDPTGPGPFDTTVFGLNRPVVGFAMFGGGAVLAQLGSGMSKAARRRQERRPR